MGIENSKNNGIEEIGDSQIREEQEKQEKTREKALLKRASVALLVLAGIIEEPKPAEAIDIEPRASWYEGVNQAERAVYLGLVEGVTTYAIDEREKAEWLKPDHIITETSNIWYRYSNDEAAQQEPYEITCEIHTHNFEALAKEFPHLTSEHDLSAIRSNYLQTGELTKVDFPPSHIDLEARYRELLEDKHHGVPSKDRISGVAAPNGLWYFQVDTASDAYNDTMRIIKDTKSLMHIPESMEDDLVDTLYQKFPELGRSLYSRTSSRRGESLPDKRQHLKRMVHKGRIPSETIAEIWETVVEDARYAHFKQFRFYLFRLLKHIEQQIKLSIEGDEGVDENRNVLIEHYKKLGVATRFVTYEQLRKEPPCAGLAYSKEQQNLQSVRFEGDI